MSGEVKMQHENKQSKNGNISLSFEKFVSTQTVSFFSQQMDISMPVPLAIIACEGDINTITEINQALEYNLPVIIMKGSGKAADLILDYIDKPEDFRKNASNLLGIRFNEKDYTDLGTQLSGISKKTNLIGRFDLDQDDPLILSNIIGQVVVSCWSMNEKEDTQMKGSTIATKFSYKKIKQQSLEGYEKDFRPYVLNPKYSCPTSLPLYFYFGYQLVQEKQQMKECGPVLLLEALKANRCDYVRVLLDRGVQLYLRDLHDLYRETVACQGCDKHDHCLHMPWILKQINEEHAFTLLWQKKKKRTMKFIVLNQKQPENYVVKFCDTKDTKEKISTKTHHLKTTRLRRNVPMYRTYCFGQSLQIEKN